ncbi:MAG: N-acetyl-gamma-glutamyl-phosphate reductase [Ferruginibacter sp.]|nr:N-acetyl-gamma-glutamyl-phosphate reductase [Chitinophagaceae bacterium]MBP6287887.1 N-acetyl-gamma-glutamyl-phosphate reductase [Ferruginibacter sp.]MBU9936761.1 N-acetyl-gamma-glutamyl-phosphate reductase [Ferruginibacter sp.]
MANKIKAGIVGGAGYTGGELVRILLNHPAAEMIFVRSKSNAGNFLHSVHQDLLGETDMRFAAEMNDDIDVLFLCVGHGEAKTFLEKNTIGDKIKIIDLSQDFRLGESVKHRKFIYGLPELNKEKIKAADNVANPGCFATAIQLGLLPLAKAGLLQDIYTTGITGSTGAGQALNATSHFSWRANNIQAYKTLTHQHLAEIGQSFLQLNPSGDADLSFIPWRGDFTRGIFISSQVKCELSMEELNVLYNEYYATHPFVSLSGGSIYLKQVVNTNRCFIQLEKVGSKLVIHSIIDNLLKGASGQAVQNMNLMFGLDEMAGLKLKANYF